MFLWILFFLFNPSESRDLAKEKQFYLNYLEQHSRPTPYLEKNNEDEIREVVPKDTLSGITKEYFNELKHWPKIWSFNSQIKNPHWIEPADDVFLGENILSTTSASAFSDVLTLGSSLVSEPLPPSFPNWTLGLLKESISLKKVTINPRFDKTAPFQFPIAYLMNQTRMDSYAKIIEAVGGGYFGYPGDEFYVKRLEDFPIGKKFLVVKKIRSLYAGSNSLYLYQRKAEVELSRLNTDGKSLVRVTQILEPLEKGDLLVDGELFYSQITQSSVVNQDEGLRVLRIEGQPSMLYQGQTVLLESDAKDKNFSLGEVFAIHGDRGKRIPTSIPSQEEYQGSVKLVEQLGSYYLGLVHHPGGLLLEDDFSVAETQL